MASSNRQDLNKQQNKALTASSFRFTNRAQIIGSLTQAVTAILDTYEDGAIKRIRDDVMNATKAGLAAGSTDYNVLDEGLLVCEIMNSIAERSTPQRPFFTTNGKGGSINDRKLNTDDRTRLIHVNGFHTKSPPRPTAGEGKPAPATGQESPPSDTGQGQRKNRKDRDPQASSRGGAPTGGETTAPRARGQTLPSGPVDLAYESSRPRSSGPTSAPATGEVDVDQALGAVISKGRSSLAAELNLEQQRDTAAVVEAEAAASIAAQDQAIADMEAKIARLEYETSLRRSASSGGGEGRDGQDADGGAAGDEGATPLTATQAESWGEVRLGGETGDDAL